MGAAATAAHMASHAGGSTSRPSTMRLRNWRGSMPVICCSASGSKSSIIPCTGPALHETVGRVCGPAKAMRGPTGTRWLASSAGTPGSSISMVPLNHQLMLHSGVAA